jgi:hypothetical protein
MIERRELLDIFYQRVAQEVSQEKPGEEPPCFIDEPYHHGQRIEVQTPAPC